MIIITACYGAYDTPKKPPPGVDAAYAFTDDPRWFDLGWKPGPSRHNAEVSHRYRGKAPKCAPHLFFADQDVLWVDASMESTGADVRMLKDLVPVNGLGCFKHRHRDCIYHEADASLVPGFTRYLNEPIREQAAHYRDLGHPVHYGLWELGFIFWRGAQRLIGERWLAEQLAWTSQDQISFPHVVRSYSFTPTVLKGNAVQNQFFKYVQHDRNE